MKKEENLIPLLDRFATKFTVAENGCWQWVGAIGSHGYGVVQSGRREDGLILAHRFSYEHFIGQIPSGLVIDHICRNKFCVNPNHLEPVSCLENTRRGLAGEKNRAKTHCAHGHEYSLENTAFYKTQSGVGRRCRICEKQRGSLRARQRKEARRLARQP